MRAETTTSPLIVARRAQDRRHEQPPLPVEPRLLAVVADALEVALLDPVGRGQRGESRLDLLPDRQRVDQGVIPRHRGDEELGAEALFQVPPEVRGDFQTPFVVDRGYRASAKHLPPQ